MQKLPRGVHYYKFIVDGDWKYNPDDQSAPDDTGNINNYIDNSKVEANAFENKLPDSHATGGDRQGQMDEEPQNIMASLGINVNDTSNASKNKPIGSSFSKKSMLFGLQLDSEAPGLPECFEGALFLNRKNQKTESFSSEMNQFKDFAFIMQLIDNPLAPPTHAEV